jgi:hypothetical protein
VTKPSNDVAKASSLVVTSGNIGKVFYSSTLDINSSITWIIASGATNYMTFNHQYVSSIK